MIGVYRAHPLGVDYCAFNGSTGNATIVNNITALSNLTAASDLTAVSVPGAYVSLFFCALVASRINRVIVRRYRQCVAANRPATCAVCTEA